MLNDGNAQEFSDKKGVDSKSREWMTARTRKRYRANRATSGRMRGDSTISYSYRQRGKGCRESEQGVIVGRQPANWAAYQRITLPSGDRFGRDGDKKERTPW